MFAGTCLLLAASLAAPAPPKSKDTWVGQMICLKAGNPETYRRAPGGEFELQKFGFRYLDLRVAEEKGEYLALQHDDQIIWVKKESALRPRDAINFYTAELDKDPTDERAISCRCAMYMAAGDYDRALKDAEEAVRLSPGSVAWLSNRGEVLIKRKEYDKAIAEYTAILELVPGYYFAQLNRSEAYLRTKKFAEAIADLEPAIASNPNVPILYVHLARARATAPDPKVRDGKQALAAATKALEMLKYRDGRLYDTVAATYAETGDFDKAIEYQQKAFDDAEFMKEEGDAARKRLKLYRDKKPFRDE